MQSNYVEGGPKSNTDEMNSNSSNSRRESMVSLTSVNCIGAIPEEVSERTEDADESSTEVLDRLGSSDASYVIGNRKNNDDLLRPSISNDNDLDRSGHRHSVSNHHDLDDSGHRNSHITISDIDAAHIMEKLERSASSSANTVRANNRLRDTSSSAMANTISWDNSSPSPKAQKSDEVSTSTNKTETDSSSMRQGSDQAQASALRAHSHTRRHHQNKRMSVTKRLSIASQGISRRMSRFSMIVSEVGAEGLRAVPQTMEKYLDPDEIEDGDFDNILIGFFAALQLAFFGFIMRFFSFPTYTLTGPTMIGSFASMVALTKTIDKTTRGERIVNIIGLTIILMMTTIVLMVSTSSCTHCVYHWAEDAMASSQDFTGMETNNMAFSDKTGVAWELLLSPDDSDGDAQQKTKFTTACRKCVSSVFVVFLDDWSWKPSWQWIPFVGSQDSHNQEAADKAKEAEIVLQEEAKFHLQPYQNADSMFGDLAAWYLHFSNRTAQAYINTFNQKFATALSADGHLTDTGIADVMETFLCSPASRVDNPDPNKFLSDLKKPRFTGEQSLNISTAALQRIMRGDILKEIGVALCFVLRFALFVPEDHELEHKAISYTQLFPPMNDKGMKTYDYTKTLYFFTSPGFDQDIDVGSSNMKALESLVDIFTRFDFKDAPIYFDTKEEYYAFYRWELESTIQDDWYFPRWFLQTEKAADVADFMADKLKFANDYTAFENPTSDKTLGERVFWGPSAKFLTQIKLPGIDDDFEFMFPGKPENYMTDQHREGFRYNIKPSREQLLNMIYKFWPKEAKRAEGKGRRGGEVPLARFKDKVAEIDLSVFAKLPTREAFFAPGCILYMDPKSKLPMGIWESSRKRMFLPGEKDWEHAKFFYRVTERVVVATWHVFESHFTWSQPFATAAWQTLPESHGLRILTKPYTLHTHSVNWAAYHMLGRNHSILNHASGYTQDGYTEFFMILHKDLNFSRSVPMMFEESKMDNVMDANQIPFHSQGKRLWRAHREFVESYVKLLYPTDRDMLDDDSVVRFWHHANTYGRNMDPCVCGLESDLFFDDKAWPGFEEERTCMQLLDLVKYGEGKHDVTRRHEWCTKEEPFTRVQALRSSIQLKCDIDPSCSHLPYGLLYMRPDMGLKSLETRDQLIDYIATVIWHVTSGHNVNSDNIPSFSDPDFSGVRMREFGPGDGELMRRMDVGAYIFGTTIASLTSLRAPPLLGDWTPLYSHYAMKQMHLSGDERMELFRHLDSIHKRYKFSLLDLGRDFMAENLKRPINKRWSAMNPATQASSVSV